MAIDLEVVKDMKGDELVRLARALDIPLTARKIKRDLLIEDILQVFTERRETEGVPEPVKLHEPAIKISGMMKKFGRKVAVKSLDLEVYPGEIVGLVGPNGAGKTTTLRVLTGIIKATKGNVFINGHNIRKRPVEAKYRIGYIPERPTCYPSLKVREYLTFIARIYGIPQEVALVRMREFVDMLQLDEFLDIYIGTLSKGNLQRTLLVGIFIRDPPFILAFDEPIYGLDPRGAWSLKAHIRRLKAKASSASSHTFNPVKASSTPLVPL